MIKKHMFKKILSILLLATVLTTTLLTPVVKAQETTESWYNQSFQAWYTKVYDDTNPNEIFGERYTAAQVQWIFYSIAALLVPLSNDVAQCIFTGEITSGSCEEEINNLISVSPNPQPETAKGFFQSVFEERPLSLIHYGKETARKFNLIPEAQAQEGSQGFGFSGLNFVLDLWRATRNVAYTLFVVIILALAFMIMFRVKISPQTVISVQSALPKIAIALVLVTFSYAIAGLLVDLMYVVMGLISLVIASSGSFFSSSPVAIYNFLTRGAITVLGQPFALGLFGIFAIYSIMFGLVLFFALFLGNGIIGASIEGVFTLGATLPLFSIIGILAGLILLILFIIAFFRVAWLIIRTFATILLLTIAAPFQITLGVVAPGVGFGAWLRTYVSNLAVFPLTSLLITLSFIFLIQTVSFTAGNFLPDSWALSDILTQVPGIGSQINTGGWPPLLGISGRMMSLVFLGVSLAIIMIIPKTAELIKGLIQGKPFEFGSAIGQALGPTKLATSYGAGYLGKREALEREIPGGSARKAGLYRAISELLGGAGRR
jgi:hypothetical protein